MNKIIFFPLKALRSFLDAFDTPGQQDGIITKEEFRNYYSIISAKIPDDASFVIFMNSSFYSILNKANRNIINKN